MNKGTLPFPPPGVIGAILAPKAESPYNIDPKSKKR
jgi:hypothetical protein